MWSSPEGLGAIDSVPTTTRRGKAGPGSLLRHCTCNAYGSTFVPPPSLSKDPGMLQRYPQRFSGP
jgi:hypothetical protein